MYGLWVHKYFPLEQCNMYCLVESVLTQELNYCNNELCSIYLCMLFVLFECEDQVTINGQILLYMFSG